MSLKKKFIIIEIVAVILIITYFIGAHFLNKTTKKDDKVNSNLDTAIDLTGNEFEIRTSEITHNLAKKEYNEIYKNFSREFKKQKSLEEFTANCNSIIDSVGTFKEYGDTIITENEDSVTAKSFIKYTKKGLCINLFLDLTGKIDGITLDYCTVPIKTKKYTEYYISIGKYSLHGLLTLPNNVSNPPVVVLVQDKGSLDMDNNIYFNKPFANIARGLAKRGIASVRFNKRYYQYDKLSYNEYTIQEEMLDDVNSAIELVMKDDRVDNENIFVAGHGLGGSLTPYIANHSSNIKGIISLAGSPRHLADIIYDNQMCEIGTDNISNNDKISRINSIKSDVQKIKNLKKGGKALILGQNKTFWYSLNKINLEKEIENINVPVLCIQGSADSQIYEDIDFALWKKLLKNNKKAACIEYDNLNHYMINVKDKDTKKTEYKIRGSVDSTVISDISKWILDNKIEQ